MVCGIYKFVMSRYMNNHRALPEWVRAHLRTCPKCATYVRTCEKLADTAAAQPSECPTDLHQRILAATPIQRTELNTRNAQVVMLRRPNTAALLAASIFIALAGWWALRSFTPNDPISIETLTHQTLTDPVMTQVNPQDWNDMMTTTLGGEVAYLYRDTEDTVNYLVACLPKTWN